MTAAPPLGVTMRRALPVDVVVRLRAWQGYFALAGSEGALRDEVTAYLDALTDRLAIAVRPEVAIRTAQSDDEFLPGEAFRLRVREVDAPTPFVADVESPSFDPGGDVARALFASRALLVDAGDVVGLRVRLGIPDAFDADAVLGAARELATLGVRLDRLVWPTEPSRLPAAVDAAHDLALGVALRCDPEAVADVLAAEESIRQLASVPVPPFQVSAGPDVSGAFQLRLNDAPLPPRRYITQPSGSAAPYSMLLDGLRADLAAHTALLVSGGLVDALLAASARLLGALVAAVRARYASHVVADVLRRLEAERVPLDDVRAVLEALLRAVGRTTVSDERYMVFTPSHAGMLLADGAPDASPLSGAELAEVVRVAMGRPIRARLSGSGAMYVHVADAAFEAVVGVVPAHRWRDVVRQLLDATGLETAMSDPCLVATSSPVRRRLRALLEGALPNVFPIAWSEIPPDADVQVVGRIE